MRTNLSDLVPYLCHLESCAVSIPGGTRNWVAKNAAWEGDEKVCTCGLAKILLQVGAGAAGERP